MNSIEAKLEELGIVLPEPDAARGRYSPAARSGDQIFLAGQGPTRGPRIVHAGRVGAEVDLAAAREAALLSMVNLLAQLKRACGGDLSRVVRCLSATVYVNSAPDFFDQPAVADGATDLLAKLWGDGLLPARSAIGVFALPMNIAVEIDAVFQVSPPDEPARA
jgi:enamine deaminase RidA (YjgF/YER057c/UK114 family)